VDTSDAGQVDRIGIGNVSHGDRFQTTRWSVVLAANDAGASASASTVREALDALCRAYWFPLYAFARRQGNGAEAAQDLTQAFFVRLLEKDIVGGADPTRGRFRAYLLGAFKHFLADERDRQSALKRGGGHVTFSRDAADAERRYALDAAHDVTPERLFDRQWALTLVELVLSDLRGQMGDEGKGALFDRLKAYLTSDPDQNKQAETAATLGMSHSAFRVTLHRFRRRYRDCLLGHISQTVTSADEMEDEVRHLFQAVRR